MGSRSGSTRDQYSAHEGIGSVPSKRTRAPGVAARVVELWWRALGHPWTAPTIIVGFCTLLLIIRAITWANVDLDMAEIYVLPQEWQLTYGLRHPPLLLWLAKVVLDLTGESVSALYVMKSVILGAGLYAYYRAALEILEDRRLAVIALLALLSMQSLRSTVHLQLVFTVPLISLLALSFLFFMRALKYQRKLDWILLGICVALGSWIKYIFMAQAGCVFIGALLVPGLRARVQAAGAALAAAIAVPFAVVAYLLPLLADYSLTQLTIAIMRGSGGTSDSSLWISARETLFAGLQSSGVYFVPGLLLFGLASWSGAQSLDRGAFGRSAAIATTIAILIGIASFAIYAIVMKATVVYPQWLLPFLMFLPIPVAYWASRTAQWRQKAFAALLCALFAVAPVYRVYTFQRGLQECPCDPSYWPLKALAEKIGAHGFREGTIVASDYLIAGAMRQAHIHSRIIAAGLPPEYFGHHRALPARYLVVWPTGDFNAAIKPYAQRALRLRNVQCGRVEMPMPGETVASLSYVIVEVPAVVGTDPITGEQVQGRVAPGPAGQQPATTGSP